MAAVGATCYAYLDGGTYDIAPCGDLEADAQVDIAVAPCDAAASDAGLAFEFGGASFDLPAEAYVSEQDCGDGEFLDCRGLCWPDEFLEYARDDSCDDGRLGPDLFCRNRGYEYNDPDDDEYLQDPSWARTPRIMKRDSPGSGRRFFPRVELPTRRRRADDADAAPVVATREETVSALHASRSEADIWGAAPNVEEHMFEEVEL
ncbi:aspartic-type endopeptidase [Aureococcus anophagefferens]|nr:aspartic-type endopeptidase [Aureococcus anophagefferens]